jgi:hypothetical protein
MTSNQSFALPLTDLLADPKTYFNINLKRWQSRQAGYVLAHTVQRQVVFDGALREKVRRQISAKRDRLPVSMTVSKNVSKGVGEVLGQGSA